MSLGGPKRGKGANLNSLEKGFGLIEKDRLLFKDFAGTPSIVNLDPVLELTTGNVAPIMRYKGGDATADAWPAWGYGEDLVIAGSGTLPSLNVGSPLLGDNDDSVKGNAGKYYIASNTSAGDIGTKDIILEVILKMSAETKAILCKYAGSGGQFWQVYTLAGGSLYFAISDGTNSAYVVKSGFETGVWYHIVIMINRSESGTYGGSIVANGVNLAATNTNFSAVGSISNDQYLTILDRYDFPIPYDQSIAYLAMYTGSNIIQAGSAGEQEIDVIAKERFQRLIGIYPQKARGTYTPSTAARASAAYLEKYEDSARKLYRVGSNWLRTVKRSDASSEIIQGYLAEEAVTNSCLQSQTFDNASWTKTNCTITADAGTAPDGTETKDAIVASAVDQLQLVSQGITLEAKTYCFSVYAKKGGVDWLYLNDATVANCDCYFDLNNVALGTKGAGATAAYIVDCGNDIVRCTILFQGTAASHDIRIYAANDDNDPDFAGDASTPSIYIWGAQIEKSTYPTTYIPTTTATVTRASDNLIYSATDNVKEGSGSLSFDLLALPVSSSGYDHCCWIYNTSTKVVQVWVRNGVVSCQIADTTTQATINGSISVVDGNKHHVEFKWAPNNTRLYVDGTLEGQDTTCTMPSGLTTIRPGSSSGTSEQGNLVISNFKIEEK